MYSIVFTTYNDSSGIVQFLEEITNQTLKPEYIIMADGGSKDETVKLAEEFRDRTGQPLKIISGKRLNIAEGYNVAIKAAATEYVGIVGVGNHYEQHHFEYLMNNSLKTGVDISYAPVRGFDTTDFSKWYNQFILNGKNGAVGKVPSNHSALIKSSVFEKIGFFYEKFFYAGEDTEFYYRALYNGVSISVVKEAEVYWETPQNFSQYLRQMNLYTIGDMQTFGNIEIIKRKRKCIYKWIVLLVLLIGGIAIKSFLGILCGLLLIFLYYLLRYREYGVKGSWLCMVSGFLPVIFIMKNMKYFLKKNKVLKV